MLALKYGSKGQEKKFTELLQIETGVHGTKGNMGQYLCQFQHVYSSGTFPKQYVYMSVTFSLTCDKLNGKDVKTNMKDASVFPNV